MGFAKSGKNREVPDNSKILSKAAKEKEPVFTGNGKTGKEQMREWTYRAGLGNLKFTRLSRNQSAEGK